MAENKLDFSSGCCQHQQLTYFFFFCVSCFGSSPGPVFSPGPTAITIQDGFRLCPTFPTSDISWAFPGDGGQEIKFRAMLYICENGGNMDPNLPLGSTWELLFLFISSFIAHNRKNEAAPSQRKFSTAVCSANTVPDQ